MARPKTEDFKTTHSKHSICNPWLQAYILKLNICILDTFIARIERIHLCYFSITWNFYSAIYSCTENETKKTNFSTICYFSNRGLSSLITSAHLKRELSTNCLLFCRTAYQQRQLRNLDLESFCKMSRNRWKQNFPEIGHKVIETLGSARPTDNRSSSVFRVCDRFSTITELIDDYHLYSLFYKEI